MEKLNKFLNKQKKNLYSVFRILIGLLFLQHGLSKLFGFWSPSPVPLFSLFGLGGVIEFAAGIALTFGFLTQLTGFLGAIYMFIVYIIFHLPSGFFPIANGGELAALFFAAFLIIASFGHGKWSIDGAIQKSKK